MITATMTNDELAAQLHQSTQLLEAARNVINEYTGELLNNRARIESLADQVMIERANHEQAMDAAAMIVGRMHLAKLESERDVHHTSTRGMLIKCGTDDTGQPRMLIHSTEADLRRLNPLPMYMEAEITFRWNIQPEATLPAMIVEDVKP